MSRKEPRVKAVIYGQARPQGSPRAVIGGNGRAYVTEDRRGGRGYRSWRQQVSREMMEDAPKEAVDGPMSVTLRVYVLRPQGHYGTGKNAGRLKESAPSLPVSGIDLDKIQRAVGDAGTGIWWRDDSRIVEWSEVRRLYAEDGRERVEVEAFPL